MTPYHNFTCQSVRTGAASLLLEEKEETEDTVWQPYTMESSSSIAKGAEGTGTQAYKVGSDSGVFHERQRWLRCGLHAVNNVLQQAKATPRDFEAIAESHVHITGKGPLLFRLGLGDYDGNTMIEFLQDHASCDVCFVDRRRASDMIRQLASANNLKGFLLNIRRKRAFIPSFIYNSRHWLAVVRIDKNDWYLVDSSKAKAEKIDDAVVYLENIQNDENLDANLMAVTGLE